MKRRLALAMAGILASTGILLGTATPAHADSVIIGWSATLAGCKQLGRETAPGSGRDWWCSPGSPPMNGWHLWVYEP
ncbi:hypothetical protein [Rhizohabitans arisaemae]|uniref:hypothetical protein n=1 Tax=Rhizohabitans arisaemae TaxID=2720610 RepID=UPI0024B284D3|nr:hypothetical protein [Rhizohabitans arisaemae]